jgi:hypothetical protein
MRAEGNGVDGSANVPRPLGSSFISLHRPPRCPWQTVLLGGCGRLFFTEVRAVHHFKTQLVWTLAGFDAQSCFSLTEAYDPSELCKLC